VSYIELFFFYGQRYGLAIIEAPAAALNFLIFGVGAAPLKLAMLAVWLAGILRLCWRRQAAARQSPVPFCELNAGELKSKSK
jgi:hypothetical protein